VAEYDVASETQAGIRAALLADADFAALDLAIYDEPPQDEPAPFVRFGRIEARRDDTDGFLGWIVALGLEAHSRPKAGRIEAQQICGKIAAALHRQPGLVTVTGFAVIEVEAGPITATRAVDGATYTGTVAVSVRLDAL